VGEAKFFSSGASLPGSGMATALQKTTKIERQ